MIAGAERPVQRLRRSIRIGVSRRRTFRPFCNLGITADGGIWISPVQLRDYAWSYGVTATAEHITRPLDLVTVPERPKLHYHRSGRAYVTLTGTELPHRSLRLPPIPEIGAAQIMSVVAQRPWEFAVAEQRKGDLCLVSRQWPASVGLVISLVQAPPSEVQTHPQLGELAPLGLLAADDSAVLVNLEASVPGSVLVIQTFVHREPIPDLLEPSVSVAALPWDPAQEQSARGLLALWSAPLTHPLVAQASAEQLVTREALAEGTKGEILLADLDEHANRIFGPRAANGTPRT